MKKIILSLVAILAISSTAMSQQKFLSWGVKAGLNFASMSDFTTNLKNGSLTSKPDFVGGLFVEVRPINLIGVSAELLYSGQGYKTTGELHGMAYSNTINLGYINVPILANVYIFKGLAIKAGVQAGFNVGANSKVSIDGVEVKTNIRDSYKSADFAIPVGVSYNFDFGLIVDARYTFGVTDISKESVSELVRGNYKNSIFSVSLAWRF